MEASKVLLVVLLAACHSSKKIPLTAPAVVPFELRGDYALLQVRVNGVPATLILDSGSGALVLDSAFARIAGVEMSRFIHAKAEGSTTTSVEIGNARELRVGAATLVGVRVASVDFHDVRAKMGRDIQGAIGYDLFKRFVVVVDYEARTMTLEEPATFNYGGTGVVLPLTFAHDVPVVAATIMTRTKGSIPARLHLDLGSAAYALRLSNKFVTRHGIEKDTTTVTGPFGTGVGGAVEGLLLRLPQLRIGSLTVNRPSTAISRSTDGALGINAATDGTIGGPILRRARLILDYSRARAIFEPRSGFELADSVDASGLSLGSTDGDLGGVRVSYVVADGAGARAGVRVGDELKSVDGVSVASPNPQRAREMLRPSGTTRNLLLQRGNDTLTVQIHLSMVI
jgi:hypothetical protein